MQHNPFTIEIYDKNLAFQGYVGDPISLSVTPRWNAIGTALLQVDINHRLVEQLTADGARMVIRKEGLFILSGKITQRNGEGPSINGVLSVQVKSDFRLLSQVLGWPVPAAPLTGQTSEYYVATGNAETIVKNVVTANMINRLGMNVTVGPNLGRGAVVPDGVSFRFHPLAERLFPAIEAAGIGITFEQQGEVILCEVQTPQAFPMLLTEQSGVVQSWTWTTTDPTATRVVSGGQGEGTARLFTATSDTALEADHNDIFEVFRDARDADSDTVLGSRTNEALVEGVSTSGFTIHLAESGTFQYGKYGLVVGAMVTLSVGGVQRTDILREVTMTYDHANGIVVTPIVGDIQDNPDRAIANFLARLKKSVADLKVSK
jgi:hypothetical protein